MKPAAPTAVVVGGGPAGLIAAETLAASGLSVEVVEQRRSVGRKFLLAGRGGLNITHDSPVEELIARYRGDAGAISAAVRAFGPGDLRHWCASLGEPTFVGTSGHVFPASFRATPLLRAWLERLRGLGVRVTTDTRWLGWEGDELRFDDDQHRSPDVTVLALGGASWPRTGSDARWVTTLAEAGYAVADLGPSNSGVTVAWSDVHRERFAGTPIKNAAVTCGGAVARGDLLITMAGLEGAPIYAVGHHARNGPTPLTIDLRPDHEPAQLEALLARTRRPKDSFSTWLRRAGFAPVAVSLLREATGNRVPRESAPLTGLCKATPLHVDGRVPIERAISTAGGLRQAELTESFMLRARPGTFVAGEMLDWDAPTGGYLLQACFSTGVAAARGALDHLGVSHTV